MPKRLFRNTGSQMELLMQPLQTRRILGFGVCETGLLAQEERSLLRDGRDWIQRVDT